MNLPAPILDPFKLLNLPLHFALSSKRVKSLTSPLLRLVHPDGPCGDARLFAVLQEARTTLLSPSLRAECLCNLRRCTAKTPSEGVLALEMELTEAAESPKYKSVLIAAREKWLKMFQKKWNQERYDECAQIVALLKFIDGQLAGVAG